MRRAGFSPYHQSLLEPLAFISSSGYHRHNVLVTRWPSHELGSYGSTSNHAVERNVETLVRRVDAFKAHVDASFPQTSGPYIGKTNALGLRSRFHSHASRTLPRATDDPNAMLIMIVLERYGQDDVTEDMERFGQRGEHLAHRYEVKTTEALRRRGTPLLNPNTRDAVTFSANPTDGVLYALVVASTTTTKCW